MPPSLLDKLESLPRAAALAGVFALGGLIAYFDLAFGPRVSLWVCYIVPVGLASWLLGGRLAAALALLAAMTSLFDGPAGLGRPFHVEQINLLAERAAVLVVVAALAAFWRRSVGTARHLEHIDALTGLENRTSFRKRAEAEINRARRTGRSITLAFLDCDNFKQVNDTRGHLAGDELLKTVANVLLAQTRNYDVAARISGDEFLVLLPDTTAESANTVVQRLKVSLHEAMRAGPSPVTFSIGVATFAQPPESVDELIHAADVAMYKIKASSKNAAAPARADS